MSLTFIKEYRFNAVLKHPFSSLRLFNTLKFTDKNVFMQIKISNNCRLQIMIGLFIELSNEKFDL